MGYSNDPSMVRVDFFRKSGRWLINEAVKWTGSWKANKGCSVQEELAKSLRDHFKDSPYVLSDCDAVCLRPYHEYAHPIMIKNGGWIKENEDFIKNQSNKAINS